MYCPSCCWSLCVYLYSLFFFFFKHKTAYEVRISDWSSDVCSSDLAATLDLMSDPAPAREAVSSAAAADVVQRVVANLELAVRAPRDKIGRASCRERECQYV